MTQTTMQAVAYPVTLQQTQRAMESLRIAGKVPNGKVAFWNGVLSTRNKLDRNCRQAEVMRSYVNRPLPINRDELRVELGGLLSRTLNALYEIERLWNAGIIHFNCGDTFALQSAWRDSMTAIIPGMGEKTVSFALHIYAPEQCRILTIDVWHLRRVYGRFDVSDITLCRKQYLELEQRIAYDIDTMRIVEGSGYWYVTYAACMWERTRKSYGASQSECEDEYQDHSGLSCYV